MNECVCVCVCVCVCERERERERERQREFIIVLLLTYCACMHAHTHTHTHRYLPGTCLQVKVEGGHRGHPEKSKGSPSTPHVPTMKIVRHYMGTHNTYMNMCTCKRSSHYIIITSRT